MLCYHGIIMAPADIQFDQSCYADTLVVVRFLFACDQVNNPDNLIYARFEPPMKSFGNRTYTETKSSISGQSLTSKLEDTLMSGIVREWSGCHQNNGKPVSENRELGSPWPNSIVFMDSSMFFQVQHNPVPHQNFGAASVFILDDLNDLIRQHSN